MNTVKFGTLDSYSDLHSILNKKTIGTPTPKKETVSVAGRDGEIDLTDYFGEVKYNNRTLKFDFTLLVKPSLFASTFSDIQDKLHGQLVKITLSDDDAYYYMGRLTVGEKNVEKGICTYTVEADCEPYKNKQAVTTVTQAISGSGNITCNNSRKKVIPTITTDSDIQIAFGGNTYAISAGTTTVAGIVFDEGQNVLAVTGTANVIVSYQEARL